MLLCCFLCCSLLLPPPPVLLRRSTSLAKRQLHVNPQASLAAGSLSWVHFVAQEQVSKGLQQMFDLLLWLLRRQRLLCHTPHVSIGFPVGLLAAALRVLCYVPV